MTFAGFVRAGCGVWGRRGAYVEVARVDVVVLDLEVLLGDHDALCAGCQSRVRRSRIVGQSSLLQSSLSVMSSCISSQRPSIDEHVLLFSKPPFSFFDQRRRPEERRDRECQ